jgi:hypothetical protein
MRVIPSRSAALFQATGHFSAPSESHMKRLSMSLILIGIITLSGCVVAPYGYGYRYYYGPRVAVVAPVPVAPLPVAPVVVVR